MVDTNLTDLQLSVKAFTSTNVTMNNKWLGTQFLPIATEIKTLDVEKIGRNFFKKRNNFLKIF